MFLFMDVPQYVCVQLSLSMCVWLLLTGCPSISSNGINVFFSQPDWLFSAQLLAVKAEHPTGSFYQDCAYHPPFWCEPISSILDICSVSAHTAISLSAAQSISPTHCVMAETTLESLPSDHHGNHQTPFLCLILVFLFFISLETLYSCLICSYREGG